VKAVAASARGVQLAVSFWRERVLTVNARLMDRFNAGLAECDPSIIATALRSRGTRTFYKVRLGS